MSVSGCSVFILLVWVIEDAMPLARRHKSCALSNTRRKLLVGEISPDCVSKRLLLLIPSLLMDILERNTVGVAERVFTDRAGPTAIVPGYSYSEVLHSLSLRVS
jgi:hypothetical protein